MKSCPGLACRSVILLAALALDVAAAEPPAGPEAWLARMTEALERVNYSGTLVELDGDGASVMEIVHRYDAGVSTERLRAVDEVGREIIRRGDEVTAILPDQREVLVDRRDGGVPVPGPLRSRLPGLPDVPAAHYRVAAQAGPELLGRPTRQIHIRPLDTLRYGYRLWLDEATAVPLKVQLLDEGGNVLEQLLFADVRLGEPIEARAVLPVTLATGFAVRRGSAAPAAPDAASGAEWSAARLPPGFALQAWRTKPGRAPGARLSQFVYADGVATVSVFIEPESGTPDAPGNATRVGADSVFTRVAAGHRITAMGEVPLRTAEMIALAMRPLPATR